MGYSVITASNGLEALELFEKRHKDIDLVIMDMIMPQMNGRETFIKMKEIDGNAKIIIASGFTKDESLDELITAGLIGILNKPYRDYELSKLIKDALD